MNISINLTDSTHLAVPVGPRNVICSQTTSTPTITTHIIDHYEQITKTLPNGIVYDCVTMKSITVAVPTFLHPGFTVADLDATFVKSLGLQSFESFAAFWTSSLSCLRDSRDIDWSGTYSTVLL